MSEGVAHYLREKNRPKTHPWKGGYFKKRGKKGIVNYIPIRDNCDPADADVPNFCFYTHSDTAVFAAKTGLYLFGFFDEKA